MSLATDADESEPSVAFDSLPDNIRESIRAEAPDLVHQGRIPISRLRNPEESNAQLGAPEDLDDLVPDRPVDGLGELVAEQDGEVEAND